MVMHCDCGKTIQADADEQLIRAVRQHLVQDHPEVADKLADEDILGMAEEGE